MKALRVTLRSSRDVIAVAITTIITLTVSLSLYTLFTAITGYNTRGSSIEEIRVELVDCGERLVKIRVGNLGSNEITIRHVIIQDRSSQTPICSNNPLLELKPGESREIEVSCNLKPGAYDIKLTTLSGYETTLIVTSCPKLG